MEPSLDWRERTVLVTGATGFLGSHLVQRLDRAGCRVHATSRQPRAGVPDRVTWWQADMAELPVARRILSSTKPDIVFHLAGFVTADPAIDHVLPAFHSLLTSTLHVLHAAQETGCRRIILTGSLTEPRHGLPPKSAYAAAKSASVAYGRMFHALYQTPVVIVRPFMTYGPAQSPSKVIPSVVRSLLRGEAPLLSSGRVQADWVYISDIIDAFLKAATVTGIEGQNLDLGTGTLVPLRGIVEQLCEIVDPSIVPVFGGLPDRPDENEIAASTAPAAESLGWRATTSLESGLRQTVEWYRTQLAAGVKPVSAI